MARIKRVGLLSASLVCGVWCFLLSIIFGIFLFLAALAPGQSILFLYAFMYLIFSFPAGFVYGFFVALFFNATLKITDGLEIDIER